MERLAVLVLGFALTALHVFEASAYTLNGQWPGSNPQIGWFIHNPGFNDRVSGNVVDQDAAIENAAETWGDEGCSPFSFTFNGSTGVDYVSPDGVNAVIVRDLNSASTPNALATTWVWQQLQTGGFRITNFDMVFGDGAVIGVPGDGDVMSGGGIAAGNIVGAGGRDMVLTAVDNWAQGNDYWRLSIGGSCASGACTFSAPQNVDAGADVLSSSAVALIDFDGDGRQDIFLSGIDNWNTGDDYWCFRIGTNCAAGGTCNWSPIQPVDAGADVMTGGGVAVAQLDGDPRADVILVGIDNWANGDDYWRYRIGMNCDAQGQCAWSPIQQVDAGADVMTGGGVAIGDFEGDGMQEIVVFGIDNWANGDDYWRYRIGRACDLASGACIWSPVQSVNSQAAAELTGGGVTIGDIDGDRRPEILIVAVQTQPGAIDRWQYAVGTKCDPATGMCQWGPTQVRDNGGDTVSGGGAVLFDFDGDGQPDVTLAGIDNWNTGDDYWRFRIGTNCAAGGECNWGAPFSPTGAPNTFDIQSVATHEFGHAAGLNHSPTGSAVMLCSIPLSTRKRDLTCDEIEALHQLYSWKGKCGVPTLREVASRGDTLTGGGVAAGNVLGKGRFDVVVSALDNWVNGNDYWRIALGVTCRNGTCTWSAAKQVDALGDVMSSSGVALADFDSDGRDDVLLTGIDNWAQGLDYWRLRVGVGCDAQANCTWSPVQMLNSGADTLTGGGVAVGQLDADPRPDIVIAGIHGPFANQDWHYRIGMNCDAQGQCAWVPVQVISSGGTALSSGGVAIGDINGDGVPEIVFAAIEDTRGPVGTFPNDFWRYRIGSLCNTSTGACTWASPATASADVPPAPLCNRPPGVFIDPKARRLTAAGVAIGRLSSSIGADILFTAVEEIEGNDFWRHVVASGCNFDNGICTFATPRMSSSGVDKLADGGITLMDIDLNSRLDMVLVGIDSWLRKDDLWQVRFGAAPCGP
jgi:hypothetical protein